MTSQEVEPRQIAAARALRKMNRGTARTEELADMNLEAALQRHAQPRATSQHTSSPKPLMPEAPTARADAGGEDGGGKKPPASCVWFAATSATGDSPSQTRPLDIFVFYPRSSFSGHNFTVDDREHWFKDARVKFVHYKTSELGTNTLTHETTRHFQG